MRIRRWPATVWGRATPRGGVGRLSSRELEDAASNALGDGGIAVDRSRVASRFLDADLTHLGSVPLDRCVRQSAIAKRAVSETFPEARASHAFAGVTRALYAHVARQPVEPLSAFFSGGETYVRAA